MAMNGYDVLVNIDTETVGSQRNVTFAEQNAEIDVSSKDQREMRVLAGRYSANVTLDALYVPDDTAYLAIQAAMRNGTMVTLVRIQDGTTLESAQAIVTSLSEAAPDQDAATVSASFRVDGAWVTGS